MVKAEDVVIAELGAAAALGGLTLVFLGIVVTAYQGAAAGVSRRVLKRYKNPAGWLFATFLLSLADVGLGLTWLAQGGGHDLYRAALALFAAQLVAIAGTAGYATFYVLLR